MEYAFHRVTSNKKEVCGSNTSLTAGQHIEQLATNVFVSWLLQRYIVDPTSLLKRAGAEVTKVSYNCLSLSL